MRLKLDENLGLRWADQLRRAGHDAATVHGQGLSGASDPDVLAAASSEGRALVTLDLDFANPIRFVPADAAGIVVLRVRELPGASDLDAATERLIEAPKVADVTGRLWIVERSRVREYRDRSE